MTRTIALSLLLLAAGAAPAFADQAAATQCAAGLVPDARAIYDAALPQVASGSDLRNVVTEQTRSLAMAGTIAKGSARASAVAAGKCLMLAH